MPGKMNNSILRPPFRPPKVPAAVRSSRLSCGKVGKAQIFTSAGESSGESRVKLLRAFGEAVRRRDFIRLLGAAATLSSSRSRAQPQSKTYTIGYLAPARIPQVIEALQDGFRKLGYIEGQNLKIEYRFLQGTSATLDELAGELVHLHPDSHCHPRHAACARSKASDQDNPHRYGGSGRSTGQRHRCQLGASRR
jgi:hypothetical protein